MLRRVSLVLLVVAGLAPFARADVIGVGLDWRKEVFVQEAWLDGKPVYRMVSRRADPVEIRVHERRGGAQVAGPWKLEPGTLLQVDAQPLVGKDLLEWKLGDGSSLGLLESPRAGDWPAAPPKTLRTQYGLNGSGGRWPGMWIDLPAEPVAPGATVSLTLHLPEKCGTFLWSKEKQPKLSAKSDTLAIRDLPNRAETDSGKPTKSAKRHAVTVSVPVADSDPAGLVIVDGWRWTVPLKSGHGITVGVPVQKK